MTRTRPSGQRYVTPLGYRALGSSTPVCRRQDLNQSLYLPKRPLYQCSLSEVPEFHTWTRGRLALLIRDF
jgi:hypothetical protein